MRGAYREAMFDKEQFQRDPRGYALAIAEEGNVDAIQLLVACLKYMSHDDVREMLDMNELSPRFDPDDEDENEDEE